MAKDSLISIDMRVFNRSIKDTIDNLSRLGKDVEKEIGRLSYFAGTIVVEEAKRNHTYKNVTGALQRSTHAAAGNASHAKDQDKAENGIELQGTRKKVATLIGKDRYLVQVGSWLDYAYWVEVGQGKRGIPAKPYLLPAFEKKFNDVVNFIVVGLSEILKKREIK